MKYIFTNKGATFYINGANYNFDNDSVEFARIKQIFNLPENKQEQAILDLLAADTKEIEKEKKLGFTFLNNSVQIDGEEVHASLAKTILELKKNGLPISMFLNFWRNLKQNPSASSVAELYDFLSYKQLPITEDGCFIAFRGLQANGWSKHGNLNTKVLKGKVNAQGQIYNGVGEEIEVERNCVDDNRNNDCSFGVHAGSFDYAKGWSAGKIVSVKINPKDVVSVPSSDCRKLRCCAYKVLEEISQEVNCVATNATGKPLKGSTKNFKRNEKAVKQLSAFESRIDAYLKKKRKAGCKTVTVKQVRNIFSPKYPSEINVLTSVAALKYKWAVDPKTKNKIIHL